MRGFRGSPKPRTGISRDRRDGGQRSDHKGEERQKNLPTVDPSRPHPAQSVEERTKPHAATSQRRKSSCRARPLTQKASDDESMMSWMQFRIRSRWLKANLPLVILSALRSQPMSKWELIDEIYSRSGLRPEEEELRSALDLLIREGFMRPAVEQSQSRFTSLPLASNCFPGWRICSTSTSRLGREAESSPKQRRLWTERLRWSALGLGMAAVLVDISAFLTGSGYGLQLGEILVFGVLVPLTIAVRALHRKKP